MRRFILLLGTVVLFSACKEKVKEIRIEKFVFIEHNRSQISNIKDIEAITYIELLDSCHKIRCAKTNLKLKHTDYLESIAPDSLRNFVINSLKGKVFSESYKEQVNNGITHCEFNCYCLIYKFSNDKERIINYLPYTLPDSLKRFSDYLRGLSKIKTYTRIGSFDRISEIRKYQSSIESICQPAPPYQYKPIAQQKK